MSRLKILFMLGLCLSLFGISCETTETMEDPNTMTDSRDGEVYKTVKIGNQTWMAENLRYNASGSSYNSANPSTKYGRHYDWATVMNGSLSSSASPSGVQGICPSGWHLPSDAEWNALEIALGMNASDASTTSWRGTHGKAMKSTSGWTNNDDGTNSSGFNAFPAGDDSVFLGTFSGLGDYTSFWSSTILAGTNDEYAMIRAFDYRDGVSRHNDYVQDKLSCRCVKN